LLTEEDGNAFHFNPEFIVVDHLAADFISIVSECRQLEWWWGRVCRQEAIVRRMGAGRLLQQSDVQVVHAEVLLWIMSPSIIWRAKTPNNNHHHHNNHHNKSTSSQGTISQQWR